jgi:hypothetical protein
MRRLIVGSILDPLVVKGHFMLQKDDFFKNWFCSVVHLAHITFVPRRLHLHILKN